MFIIRITEIPFPIPFSVILSPNHIKIAEPAVSAIIDTAIVAKYFEDDIADVSPKTPWLPKPIDIANDSTSARPTVKYLVISAIFFLPVSPSFWSSSNFGIAIVRSCIMIEEVMYGVILNANTENCSKEPPVNALKKLNASLDVKLLISSDTTLLSVPGSGRRLPNLTIIKIANVYKSFVLISFIFNAFWSVLSIRSPHKFHQVLRF